MYRQSHKRQSGREFLDASRPIASGQDIFYTMLSDEFKQQVRPTAVRKHLPTSTEWSKSAKVLKHGVIT